jgi:hypothetical protein
MLIDLTIGIDLKTKQRQLKLVQTQPRGMKTNKKISPIALNPKTPHRQLKLRNRKKIKETLPTHKKNIKESLAQVKTPCYR